MAYNQELVHRLEVLFANLPEQFTQKKMFGGVSFLFKGKMTVGVVKEDLVVRVISEKMDTVLHKDYVRPMDFTGKPMKEFVFVAPEGFKTEEQLQYWVELGWEHAKTKLLSK